MIIGITGSSGVLGSAIIKFLKSYKFKKFYGDISVKKDIDNWLKKNKLDALIHLAAIVPINKVNKNKKKAKIVNYNGTKNLIDCLIKNYQNKNMPGCFYIHSWELTPEFMPKLDLPFKDKFTTYHNLGKAYSRMSELLKLFEFTSFSHYIKENKIVN